ncbi:hypothetical protein L1049_006427 [Liquidambar formosana]|uniref:Transposase MuDR plant domain-containing protein n=1 Tax=Liquidambar formosana TaxID=63359 RepID=A0AAP0RH82_LIQFO
MHMIQFDIEVVDNGGMAGRGSVLNICNGEVLGGEFNDMETDLLSSFCSHEERTLLSANWAHLIKNVGQCFKDGVKGFRAALRKYSVEIGFKYDFVRNESDRVTVVCKLKERWDCEWQVHARMEHTNGWFYIRQLNNVHTCEAAV